MGTATTIRAAVGGSAGGSLVFVANTGLRDYYNARHGQIWQGAGAAPAGGTRVAPTLVAKYEPSGGYATSPAGARTVSVTVAANDKLVIVATTQETAFITLSGITGGGLTYTPVQSVLQSSYCATYAWTADAGPTPQTFTFSLTSAGGEGAWGYTVFRYSGSEGFGNSNKANAATGNATLSLTTAQANSAIVFIDGDWNAIDGTTRTWATVNSFTPTAGNGGEQTYYRDGAAYSVYVGHWPDAGAAGAKTVGITAPGSQQFAVIAVEVLGAAAGSSGQSGTIAAATSGEVARSVTAAKAGSIGRVTVADTARATTVARSAYIGRATEASSALALGTRLKAGSIGRATETASARALSAAKAKAIGRVSEAQTARPVGAGLSANLGRVTEGCTARPVTLSRARSAGRVTESHTARPATAAKTTTAGRVTVSESAQALARAKSAAIGRVIASDTARAVSRAKAATLARVIAAEQARPAGVRLKTAALGRVVTGEAARPTFSSTPPILGVTVAETSRAVSRLKLRAIGRVLEANSARTATSGKARTLTRVSELSSARAVTRSKLRALLRVSVADTARQAASGKVASIGRAGDAAVARNVGTTTGADLIGQWGTDIGLG